MIYSYIFSSCYYYYSCHYWCYCYYYQHYHQHYYYFYYITTLLLLLLLFHRKSIFFTSLVFKHLETAIAIVKILLPSTAKDITPEQKKKTLPTKYAFFYFFRMQLNNTLIIIAFRIKKVKYLKVTFWKLITTLVFWFLY